MAQIRCTPILRFVSWLAEITFGHDPKRPNGCEGPTIVAVQFVPTVAIEHGLAFRSAREFETFDKGISRIDVSFVRVAVSKIVIRIAGVVEFAIRISNVDPRHLDPASIVVAIAWIEIHHGFRLWEAVELAAIRDRFEMGCLDSSKVEWRP